MTQVSNLSGPALDYAVDLALGKQYEPCRPCYSTDWEQGGPIIERERISIDFDADPAWGEPCAASTRDAPCYWVGPTPLIAAMRCFVASKLGESINLPEELQ